MVATTAAPHITRRSTKTPELARSAEWWGSPAFEVFTGAANTLNALSDPVRLQILWWLSKSERNVTDLCGLVGKRQQAVSHHLTILKLRRLVAPHRRGKSNFYRLTEKGREAMAAAESFIR